jgi:hypothetical protein
VILKGTKRGTITDVNGKFTFPERLKPGDVLQFSFIGFTLHEYVVSGNETGNLEVRLSVDLTPMGEIVITSFKR